jgi:hypothetical protein
MYYPLLKDVFQSYTQQDGEHSYEKKKNIFFALLHYFGVNYFQSFKYLFLICTSCMEWFINIGIFVMNKEKSLRHFQYSQHFNFLQTSVQETNDLRWSAQSH